MERPVELETVQREGDFVHLRLRGELSNQFWTAELRETLEEHYVDDGVRRIRVDLSPVGFIDSYGVATLLALFKESQERGKRFLVEGAGGQVREKLRITGVLELLEGGGGVGGTGPEPTGEG